MENSYLSLTWPGPSQLLSSSSPAGGQQEVAAAFSGAATHLCACLAAASRWQAWG